jgi:ethanolamine utilization protein EutM
MVKGQALGMIETFGLSGLITAADAAAKTADVRIYAYEKADAGILTVYIYGDISSVTEAVYAGKEAAKSMGKLLHHSVIPSPAFDFSQWIRKG